MFISVLELFKIGIGPSSSHTLGPMVAAYDFLGRVRNLHLSSSDLQDASIRCTLKGSLAFTGKGHSTDRAVALGLHGYLPASLTERDVQALVDRIWKTEHITLEKNRSVAFSPASFGADPAGRRPLPGSGSPVCRDRPSDPSGPPR